MAEDKVVIDDVIGLLPQEHQGIVKLAVTLSETLIAKEQALKKAQSSISLIRKLLGFIAEDMLYDSYNWKEFTSEYLKDKDFISSDSYYNIASKYFKCVNNLKVPESLAMDGLNPVLDKLVERFKSTYPEEYEKIVGPIVIFDEFEPEEISDDSEEPTD
jgi:hypothetical protein